jgi:uncharacterized HAD superfamily protein
MSKELSYSEYLDKKFEKTLSEANRVHAYGHATDVLRWILSEHFSFLHKEIDMMFQKNGLTRKVKIVDEEE